MNKRKILRELGRMLSVSEADIPKTLERFKKEIEEMEKELST